MASTKKIVTDREKEVIIRLAKAGVSTPIIADAFDLSTHAIGAFKAWDTMRG